jgi:alkanesulfonate monooxygenase SsuD/methylene tetrahydromethanopterin reductase-like flavin-dependent oxidoreductase (luciferase family)
MTIPPFPESYPDYIPCMQGMAVTAGRRINHDGLGDCNFLFHCDANPLILGSTFHAAAASGPSDLNTSGRHSGEEEALMGQRNALLVNGNALRLGLFGANCASGRTYATLAERWDASWENNVSLARLAEAIGIECMIPIARWKGYGGETNPNGASFESIAWACGLLAATRRLNVFCTVHVPLHHPVAAAKQMATADHIGQGRLGINIVCGWNDDEFQMFGIGKHAHDERYAQGEEWWSIVKRIWSGGVPFDYDGTYYRLRGVEGLPRPYGAQDPLMMNAGSSPAGRQFAIQHSDLHFDGVDTPEASIDRIAETKRLAHERGRDIQVWTPVGIVCRPTQQDADDYVQYIVDHADRGAIGYLAEMHAHDARARTDPAGLRRRNGNSSIERRVLARGAYCAIGDPDTVVRELSRLRSAGLDGLALNFVDYLQELPYFAAEVLPRLERLGLRAAHTRQSTITR